MCSPLKGFLLIVPFKATRDSQRFRFDSAVLSLTLWCDSVSQTPRDDGMHTAELIKSSNISANSKPNSKILYPVYHGPRWVRIMTKNRGRKSRDTLPLKGQCHKYFCSKETLLGFT